MSFDAATFDQLLLEQRTNIMENEVCSKDDRLESEGEYTLVSRKVMGDTMDLAISCWEFLSLYCPRLPLTKFPEAEKVLQGYEECCEQSTDSEEDEDTVQEKRRCKALRLPTTCIMKIWNSAYNSSPCGGVTYLQQADPSGIENICPGGHIKLHMLKLLRRYFMQFVTCTDPSKMYSSETHSSL